MKALCEVPPQQREMRLRAAGAVDELLYLLAEQAENLAVSEVAKALEATSVVLALADSVGQDRQRARARRARAQTLSYAGKFGEALPLFCEAADLAEQSGDTIEAARARMSSIHPLAGMGRYDEAIANGEAARDAFLTAGDNVLAARCDMNLGAAYQRRGDAAAAVRVFDRARPLMEHDPIALAKLHSNRGHALIDLDEFDEAERSYRQSLAIFEENEADWAAAIVEGNLAELATRQGRLQRAFFHFERAREKLELDESAGEVARLQAEQADAQEIVGLTEDARAGYEQALPVLEAHDMIVEAVRARAGLGRVLLRLGRLEEAEVALQQAAAGFEKLGHTAAQARIDIIRSELASRLGGTAEAEKLASRALEKLAERPADAAAARFRLAKLAQARGDLATATRELDLGISLAQELDIAPLLADLHHARGLVHAAKADSDAALADLRKAVESVERVRGTLQAERFRTAFLGERLAVYDALITALLSCNDPALVDEIFQTVERAKSRSLLDLLGSSLGDDLPEAESDQGSSEPLAEELARLQSELNVYYSRMADASSGERAGALPERIRDEIRAREKRLESIESRLANTRGVAGLFAPPAELDAIRAYLPAGAALVEYFTAGEELAALVVRDGETHVFRGLARTATLAEQIRRAHFQIRRAMRPGALGGKRGERMISDCRRELASLHDSLLRPLRTAIEDAAGLLIVPHGALHAVPFAALWDGNRHLIESCEVCTSPSASLIAGRQVIEPGTLESRSALVVGVSDERAPLIAEEARRVASTLGATQILENSDATAERVIRGMSEADTIHIACHGYFSAENPMASGLKLTDRWLTVRDVYRLRLRAGLVTLSGCETGRNVIGSGDELIGLVRGFLAAGAGRVIVSLWTVNDQSTADLMTTFYDSWYRIDGRTGMGAAAALRAAQLDVFSRQPHPVFWAPFILVGEL